MGSKFRLSREGSRNCSKQREGHTPDTHRFHLKDFPETFALLPTLVDTSLLCVAIEATSSSRRRGFTSFLLALRGPTTQ